MEKNSSSFRITESIKILFCVYGFLYMFPFPLTELPVSSIFLDGYNRCISGLNVWVAGCFLNLKVQESNIFTNGSGDGLFDYSMVLTRLVLSIFFSFLILRFAKVHLPKFRFFVWMYARYYVGIYYLLYGFSKLNEKQFLLPRFEDLERSYGSMAPMDLLWLFMGYSPLYCAFAASGEILGGFLLFFRRTVALGSLICILMMANIFVLNLSYDVPVKLHTFHFLIIGLFLLFPNIRNIFQFFVLNKTVQIESIFANYKLIKSKLFSILLKIMLLVGSFFHIQSDPPHKANGVKVEPYCFQIINPDEAKEIFHILDLETLILENGKFILRGKSGLTFESKYNISSDGTYLIDFGAGKTMVIRLEEKDKTWQLSVYENNKTLSIKLNRKFKEDYPLIRRGFHWVNEYPFYSIYK